MNKLFTALMTVAAAASLSVSASAALNLGVVAVNTTDAGSTEKVAAGGDFYNSTKFPNINISVPEYGGTCTGENLLLTSDKGLSKEIEVNKMFYEMEADLDIVVKVGNENIQASGVYTLHIPANYITLGGVGNDAADLVWTYTNTTEQGGGEDVKLELTAFTVNGVNMLGATPKLDQLTKGVPVDITINPISAAQMLTVSFQNAETGEIVRNMEIYANPMNPAVEVDPAIGKYKTEVSGRAVNKFFVGTKYKAVVTGYSSTNANNPSNQKWGPVEVTFEGASEPYRFSNAQVVSVSPETNSEVVDASTPVVITFSAPVETVTCKATEGGQFATIVDMTDITANADKTIWTIKPGASFWNGSDSEWTFMIAAKDADGLVVEGNHGLEANSEYWVAYSCFLAGPAVAIAPASGMVEELYEFVATDNTGIGFAYTATPYVINEAGETVAKVDMNSQVQYDSKGRDINDIPMTEEVLAVKSVFHLTERITVPGKYTFVIPHASFAIGTEFTSRSNRYMALEYTVVPMVAVNVELGGYAKASFKVAEGNNASVALQPEADWQVASVTLNGADVTADVVDNVYTIKDIKEEANLVAAYEYANEIEIVEEGGNVSVESVEGDRYTVTNNAEGVLVQGLNIGDVVNVFTSNGMLIVSKTASKENMKISLPAGQVYIVAIQGAAVKVVR